MLTHEYSTPALETLVYYRKTRGYSQQQMAELLGCTRPRYSRIENGVLPLSAHEWVQFLTHLDYQPSSQQLTVHEDTSILELLPEKLRTGGFISGHKGRFFLLQAQEKVGTKDIQLFLKQYVGLDAYLENLANPFPIELLLRLIQWMKARKCWQSEQDMASLAKDAFYSQLWWGSKFGAVQKLPPHRRLLTLIDDWALNSKNHQIQIILHNQEKMTLSLSIRPASFINRQLYFNDLLIKDFFGRWFEKLLHLSLNQTCHSILEQTEDQWIIHLHYQYPLS